MDIKKVGEFIRDLRKEKNLTQKELASKINVSDKAISRWETGKGLPDADFWIPLSNELEISVTELLNGEKKKDETTFDTDVTIVEVSKFIKNSKQKNVLEIIVLLLIVVCFASWLMFKGVLLSSVKSDAKSLNLTNLGSMCVTNEGKGNSNYDGVYFNVDKDMTPKELPLMKDCIEYSDSDGQKSIIVYSLGKGAGYNRLAKDYGDGIDRKIMTSVEKDYEIDSCTKREMFIVGIDAVSVNAFSSFDKVKMAYYSYKVQAMFFAKNTSYFRIEGSLDGIGRIYPTKDGESVVDLSFYVNYNSYYAIRFIQHNKNFTLEEINKFLRYVTFEN